jgi:hypothetical protein
VILSDVKLLTIIRYIQRITMIAVEFAGGLGNQLFQLAAAETIAAETGRTVSIVNSVSPKTVHTDRNYFDSILGNWAEYPQLPRPYTTVAEPSYAKQDWSTLPRGNVCLTGYFQNWRYVSKDFARTLRLPECAPLNGAFLHIRGGDYMNHWLHDVGLQRKYYRSAMEFFPADTHFYVFTNDRSYANRLGIVTDVPHTYIDSDEVTSLAQMGACTMGGICANSSYSWWGAYLNPNRTIVMPDKWFNSERIYIEGYYFPGVQVVSVT